MKQLNLSLSILIALFFLMSSCKKEDKISPKDTTDVNKDDTTDVNTDDTTDVNLSNYYRLSKHYIGTQEPNMVDIMFSVTNEDNEGVDYLTNDNFTVMEDNEALSPTETFRYIKKMDAIPYKLQTILLLDNSASVADNLDSIKKAAISMVDQKIENQEFAIYSFSDGPLLVQDFTSDGNILKSKINDISLGFPTTNLYGSVKTTVEKIREKFSIDSIQQGFLVVLTDGDDTQGSYSLSDAVSAIGDKKTYVIGLGSEINTSALEELANPGPFYELESYDKLESTFSTIQDQIVKLANSFYWLNYMSPKRTALHDLTVSVKNNINTDDDAKVSGSFNANNFSSVYSGVYANTTEEEPYGADTIRLTSDMSSLQLDLVTYWAYDVPSYQATIADTDIAAISSVNNNKIFITVKKPGFTIMTIEDVANDYSKTIYLDSRVLRVSTIEVTDIGLQSATSGGNITDDGGLSVTARGVCWSTSSNPTTTDNKTTNGSGTGSFTSNLSGLSFNTTYYVRAYATNSEGTAYGAEKTFTTEDGVIEITTTGISNITGTSATSGGNITDDGGFSVTARGVCWSTSSSPTTTDNKTTNGSGTGSFTADLSGLSSNTTYYVRAYASNSEGTAYGAERTFTTESLPSVTHNGTLYVHPVDNSDDIQWYNGSFITTGATSDTDGATNTATIIAEQGAGSYAAQVCANLDAYGYNDWYLPAKDELNALYENKAAIGGFSSPYYWSSTEDDLGHAWVQLFFDGAQYGSIKFGGSRVRCVRR